jgi:hypothetical protein
VPAAWVAAVTAVLLLVFPVGFPQLRHDLRPRLGARTGAWDQPRRRLGPAPHPAPPAELIGLVTTPLGDGAITVTMVIAYATLGLIAFLVYRLGAIWFDRWVGAVAAVIVLTRAPFLSNGLRAYVDLPYIALCLAAAGGGVAAPARRLAGAGAARGGRAAPPRSLDLLRRYLATCSSTCGGRPLALRLRRDRGRGEVIGLVALAAAAPLAWGLFDLITAGSATYSFTGTKDTVTRSGVRRAWSTWSSTGRGGWARCCSGLAWSARPAGSRWRSPSCAAARCSASPRRRSPRRLRPARVRGPGDHPPLHDARRRGAGDLRAAGLLGWRLLAPDHPGGGAGRLFAASSPRCSSPGARTSTTSLTGSTPTSQPGAIEDDLTDLADSGAFAPLCGRSPSRTTAPSPASPSTST